MALNPNKAPSLGFGISKFEGPPELTPSEDVATRTISKRLGLTGFSHSFSHTTTADTSLLILTIHTEGSVDYTSVTFDSTEGTLIGQFGSSGNSSDVRTLVYAWTGQSSKTANFSFSYDAQQQYFTQIAQNWKDINSTIASGVQLVQATGAFSDVASTVYTSSNDQGTSPNKMVCWHCVYDPRNAPVYASQQTGWTEIVEDTTGPDNIGHAFLMLENTTLPLEPAGVDLRIDWDFSSQESAGVMVELFGPPSTTNLVVAGSAPIVDFGIKDITPSAVDIAFSTTIPSVLVSIGLSPANADLEIIDHVPLVINNILLAPANDNLNIVGTAPTVVTAHLKAPAAVDLQLTGTVPILPGVKVPDQADVTFTGAAPSIDIGVNTLQGDIAATGSSPFYGFGYTPAADDIAFEQDKLAELSIGIGRTPPVGDLAFEQDKVPDVQLPKLANPAQADLAFTGTAPAISYATTQNLELTIGQADLAIDVVAPTEFNSSEYPYIVGWGSYAGGQNGWYTFPSSPQAGDIILVGWASDYQHTFDTTPGNGLIQLDQELVNVGVTGEIAYKVSDGTESGTHRRTVDFSDGGNSLAVLIRNASRVTAPTISASVESTAAVALNPPNLAPPEGSQRYLWGAFLANDQADSRTPPTNMNYTWNTVATTGSAARATWAFERSEAANFDPNVWNGSGVEQCVTWTLAIHPITNRDETPTVADLALTGSAPDVYSGNELVLQADLTLETTAPTVVEATP